MNIGTQATFTKMAALGLSSFYVFAVGFGRLPQGFGATILGVLVLWVLTFSIRRNLYAERAVRKSYLIAGMGVLIALSFALTSNVLSIMIARFCYCLVGLLLLIELSEEAGWPRNGPEFVGKSLRLIGAVLNELVYPENLKEFFSCGSLRLNGLKPKKNVVVALALSLPLLAVFHIFFSVINEDYYGFTSVVLDFVFDLLNYILNLRFIAEIISSLGLGYVFFVTLRHRNIAAEPKTKQQNLKDSIHIILGLTVILFATFSFFQSRLIFSGLSSLDFKQLSLYTQNGFWQLLFVSALGYLFFKFARSERNLTTNDPIWKVLLITFNLELILVSVFTLHKLGLLQYLFGLKDQRIYASLAALLIFGTFILTFLELFGKFREQLIFPTQIFALTISVAILGLINLETLISRSYPIHFYINNKSHKDYAYLLGNSFDNVGVWNSLMKEVQETGVVIPKDYYWGDFRSICDSNNFEKKWEELESMVITNEDPMANLKILFTYNIAQLRASYFLRYNVETVREFTRFIRSSCKEIYGSK